MTFESSKTCFDAIFVSLCRWVCLSTPSFLPSNTSTPILFLHTSSSLHSSMSHTPLFFMIAHPFPEHPFFLCTLIFFLFPHLFLIHPFFFLYTHLFLVHSCFPVFFIRIHLFPVCVPACPRLSPMCPQGQASTRRTSHFPVYRLLCLSVCLAGI